MAQDFSTQTGKKPQPLKEGEIKPNDMVTVYSTGKDNYHKDGEAFEVHTVMAEKLVEAGKVTMEPPAEKKGK